MKKQACVQSQPFFYIQKPTSTLFSFHCMGIYLHYTIYSWFRRAIRLKAISLNSDRLANMIKITNGLDSTEHGPGQAKFPTPTNHITSDHIT